MGEKGETKERTRISHKDMQRTYRLVFFFELTTQNGMKLSNKTEMKLSLSLYSIYQNRIKVTCKLNSAIMKSLSWSLTFSSANEWSGSRRVEKSNTATVVAPMAEYLYNGIADQNEQICMSASLHNLLRWPDRHTTHIHLVSRHIPNNSLLVQITFQSGPKIK